jgi:hypothetical protein
MSLAVLTHVPLQSVVPPGHPQVPPVEVLLHVRPPDVPHEPHAAPAIPQRLVVWPAKATHVVPLQQPLRHDVASHTHALPLQRCPVTHPVQGAAPVPHAENVSAVTQLLVLVLQHPAAQTFESQTHAPPLHSCVPGVHALHAVPPTPHVALADV